MNALVIYNAISDIIEERYPACHYPAEYAFLRERYEFDSTAMNEAFDEVRAKTSRAVETNTNLSEETAFSIALDRFLDAFQVRLKEEATDAFAPTY